MNIFALAAENPDLTEVEEEETDPELQSATSDANVYLTQARRLERSRRTGTHAVAREDEQSAPTLDEFTEPPRVGRAQVLDVRQHDRLGLSEIRQFTAADKIDGLHFERRFFIAFARRREPQCGLEEECLTFIRCAARIAVSALMRA